MKSYKRILWGAVFAGGLSFAGMSVATGPSKTMKVGDFVFDAATIRDMEEGRGEAGVVYPNDGDATPQEVRKMLEDRELRGLVQPDVQKIFRSSYFDARVKINVFLEPDYHTAKTNLSLQFITVYVGDQLAKVMLTSGGKPGHETSRGLFKIHDKVRWAHSATYNNAPMYFAQFFQSGKNGPDAFALHQTVASNYGVLGHFASHGCVRLHETNAAWLWELTDREGVANTLVTVYATMPTLSDEQIDEYYARLVSDNPYHDFSGRAAPKTTPKPKKKV